jgi:hypothetical protein
VRPESASPRAAAVCRDGRPEGEETAGGALEGELAAEPPPGRPTEPQAVTSRNRRKETEGTVTMRVRRFMK